VFAFTRNSVLFEVLLHPQCDPLNSWLEALLYHTTMSMIIFVLFPNIGSRSSSVSPLCLLAQRQQNQDYFCVLHYMVAWGLFNCTVLFFCTVYCFYYWSSESSL